MAAVVSSFGFQASAELADGIDAIAHDSVITFYEVQESTAPAIEEYRRQYRDDADMFQKKANEALKENLEQLLERQLILHDFQNTYAANFPESLIDEQLEQEIKDRYGNRVTLMKTLQQQGITYEKFRQQYRDRFVITQMRYKNVGSEVMISPHKIEQYYVDHKDEFKVEEQVKLRMIVLNTPTGGDATQTRKLADEILAKVNDGATFSEMASVYSQGSQKNAGGDWGWVEKSVLRKELADVAFSLKPGEKSSIIETPDACYIMLVEDKRANHVKALGEMRDEIEKTLEARERARLQKQWIERLKKKTFVRYF
jgi:parvulin-like peptidyl-prolyl isomerase